MIGPMINIVEYLDQFLGEDREAKGGRDLPDKGTEGSQTDSRGEASSVETTGYHRTRKVGRLQTNPEGSLRDQTKEEGHQ